MKGNTASAIIALMFLLPMTSCYFECDSPSSVSVGGEFFTVTYVDSFGFNYLETVYDPNGVVVFLDTTGGEDPNPRFELISPGFTGGKFGPFNFTERYIDPTNATFNNILLFGRQYDFDYYIRKDVFGVDTFRVSFLLDVDECSSFWRFVRYSRNGVPLPQYDGQLNPDILIIE